MLKSGIIFAMATSQLAILCIAAALAACSMDAVTYTPEPVCGNGKHEQDEGCDDGNSADGDGCDNNCMVTGCGNGVTTAAETCDDGNTLSGDGCDNNCKPTGCSNGVTTAGEACDDGNLVDGDGCDSNCKLTGCGNGIPTGTEVCDDGNADNTDACLTSCAVATCGDGFLRAGVEGCDDGNATTEVCDYGLTLCTVCNASCTPVNGATSYCGDGRVDPTRETCDDGNADNSDACLNTCVASPCVATVASDHWKGEYFNNRDLAGSPSIVSDDGVGMLDFPWGRGGPNTCGVGFDNFSVRWTRTFSFTAGTWRFTTYTDDGVRLSVDGVPKIDYWIGQLPTQYTVNVVLSAGNHTIEFAYFEHDITAVAHLSWERISP